MTLDERNATIKIIKQFIHDHPNEPLPLSGGAGWIHPQAALDLFQEGPLEVIDILKTKEGNQ